MMLQGGMFSRRSACYMLLHLCLLLLVFSAENIHGFVVLPLSGPTQCKEATTGTDCLYSEYALSSTFARNSLISYSSKRDGDSENSDDMEASKQRKSTPTQSNYLISPEQLEALKESVNMVSLVESYELPSFSRRGDQSATAICPFHDDRSPSLSIDNNRKMFKCFACGEGGDAFKFVRSYSALSGETMTFYESVRHVAKHFGDPNLNIGTMSSKSGPRETEEQRKARETKKQRLLLCNAAAAEFYGKALVSLPTAGPARTHLRSRGISPSTVRTFALGYAPDAYFQSKQQWGVGSLVNHLRSAGFSATEIVDAGLAKEIKRPSWKDIVELDESEKNVDDFENLMDRFRGRIMVPIFDESGKNVIAFGGRILPIIGQNVTTDFKPPKYLNSAESPVFSKKLELFGLHTAKGAIDELKKHSNSETQNYRGSIVIVEGYMDAIALWEAGFHEVVACMGTALTQEQLDKAAKAAGTMGGRIILCLDNDNAGIMAVERVCNSLFLAKTCEKFVVEVLIANLPNGTKDPGEYFESNIGDVDAFRYDVIQSAQEWSKWYIQQIVSRYDSSAVQGGPGSFANICERVSDFLATFSNPIDRTKRSYEVSKMLSGIISADSNSTSNALQIQLESDLLDMVARKASAKEIVERRVEEVVGYGTQNKTMTLKRMLEGGLSDSVIETSKLSRNATKPSIVVDKVKGKVPSSGRTFATSTSSFRKGGRAQMKRRTPEREPLTQHFKGVEISKASDAAWLGVARDKDRRKLHALTFGAKMEENKKWPKLVFFNSNDFHGDQYLTEEASNAGYVKGEVKRDAAMLEKGIGVYLSEDQDGKALVAEERLLRLLVQYLPARCAMSAAVSTSDATGARPEIDWSTEERSWLFDFLVLRGDEISEEVGDGEDPELLWNFLSNLHDTPKGAFGTNLFEEPPLAAQVEALEADSSISSAENGKTRLHAVDANVEVVQPAHIQDESSTSIHMSSSSNDIDDWSSSYDPSIFDQNEPPEEGDGKVGSMDTPEVAVIDAETVLDAKLDSHDPSEMFPIQQSPDEDIEGTLDKFFVLEEDIFATTYDETVERSYRAELEVQEALAYLLRASAARKLSNVNSNWMLASRLLDARLGAEGATSDVVSGVLELDSMNVGDLQLYCQTIMTRLHQLFNTVHELDASARRISTRLMEYSQGDNTEGKISVAKQEQVCSEIEQFVSELPEEYLPKEIDNLMDPMYVLSMFEQPGEEKNDDDGGRKNVPPIQEVYNQEVEEVAFERDMAAMEEFWGGMDNDSYSWSMPDTGDVSGRALPSSNGHAFEGSDENEEEEPIEEALARIDDEWGDWDDDISSNLVNYDQLKDGIAQETSVERKVDSTDEEEFPRDQSLIGEDWDSEWE